MSVQLGANPEGDTPAAAATPTRPAADARLTDTPDAPTTARARAKAERRAELLTAAARLFAERGFHGVRLEDVAAQVGISGPGMYRYVRGKDDLLAEVLLDISRRLEAGGRAVLEAASRHPGSAAPATADGHPDAEATLNALLAFHVDFVLTEPDLITVQDRDLANVADEPRREVRRLQRRYVELWVGVLADLFPTLDEREARARAHATFGLLNSRPRLPRLTDAEAGTLLSDMARAALLPRN